MITHTKYHLPLTKLEMKQTFYSTLEPSKCTPLHNFQSRPTNGAIRTCTAANAVKVVWKTAFSYVWKSSYCHLKYIQSTLVKTTIHFPLANWMVGEKNVYFKLCYQVKSHSQRDPAFHCCTTSQSHALQCKYSSSSAFFFHVISSNTNTGFVCFLAPSKC